MTNHDDFARRVDQHVIQGFAGCQLAEFATHGRAKNDRMRFVFDCFVNDRGSRRPRLQQFRLDRAGPAKEACAGRNLRFPKNTLAVGDLLRKLGVEWHGLIDLDDIDDRDFHVLLEADLLDHFEQAAIARSSTHGNDQAMGGRHGIDGVMAKGATEAHQRSFFRSMGRVWS